MDGRECDRQQARSRDDDREHYIAQRLSERRAHQRHHRADVGGAMIFLGSIPREASKGA